MADILISKIRLRRGNFAELPLLESAEMGYATDQRRLFIGNELQTAGTGDASNKVFAIDTDVDYPSVLKVYQDGVEINTANYTVAGAEITFNTAPPVGAVITYRHLGEIELVKNRPSSATNTYILPANGNAAETGFEIDTVNYDVAILDYTLAGDNGVRAGQMRIVVDTIANNAVIDDSYTETIDQGVTFSLDISSVGVCKLLYTDTSNNQYRFKFTYQLWNS